MTGAGLALPCPVYKYRGMALRTAAGICTGTSGFAVGRHVHITFASQKITCLAYSLKLVLYISFAYVVVLLHKEYLAFGHLEGVARLQVQHPTKNCNPLDAKGCPTNFKNVAELPYCSQNPNATVKTGDNGDIYTPHKCVYYDAFDMDLGGEIPHKTLFIPTRVTQYYQDVRCTDPLAPCPETTKLVKNQTIFAADVEDFTVLIDHSFLSYDLNVEMNAWCMLGFVNPCGHGADVDERFFGGARDLLKNKFLSMARAKSEECVEEHAEYLPILGGDLDEANKSSKVKNKIMKKKRGFAMWMSHWWQTLGGPLTTSSFDDVVEELHEENHKSHFTKIPNGDFIKLNDLLKLGGASLDHPVDANNRYDGIVVILSIEYTNIKENTWPNNVPPAYFYSAYVAPTNEYKSMQEKYGRKRLTSPNEKRRVISDYHGVFIVVKQGGFVGQFSFGRVAVLVFVFMAIDSLYRSLFLCCVFNMCDDTGKDKKSENVSLDEKITFDFELHGEGSGVRRASASYSDGESGSESLLDTDGESSRTAE